MKHFQVKVVELNRVYEMPGSWSKNDYRYLMEQMEIEDVEETSDEDFLEILLMGLQDMEIEEATSLVLKYKLPDRVTPGSRRNIAEDFMEGQRPWEEAADISLHAGIFVAGVLLHKAFPRTYSKPHIMKLVLKLTAMNPEARKLLQVPPEAAFVTRLLADGMDEHSILERLFDEQLVSHAFPEAESIIWSAQYDELPGSDRDTLLLTIFSSEPWLEDMESISEFESSAYIDHAPDNH